MSKATGDIRDTSEDATPLQAEELLKRILPQTKVNELAAQRSDLQGALQCLFHGGCILGSGLLIRASLSLGSSALLVPALMLHAFFLSFLFMPLHEALHQTVFYTPLLNTALAYICSFATLRPARHYTLYHFCHHRFTGDKLRDPELQNSLIDPDISTLPGYLLYLSGLPFWVDRVYTTLRHALLGERGVLPEEYYISAPRNKEAVVFEARVMWSLYALLFLSSWMAGSSTLFVYWVLPSVLGQPFLRFYLLAEHNGCKLGNDMMVNTRTTLTLWFYRRLAWNMPYHAEHHAWPTVPFHLLPRLFELIGQASVAKSGCEPSGKDGYVAVHRGILGRIGERAAESAKTA